MTPRMLAAATRALRESGSRELPVTAFPVGVVGQFRRQMLAIMFGVLGMTVLSQVLGLRDKSVVRLLISQVAIGVVLVVVLGLVLARTLKGDPMLEGARSGLVVVTSKGLRLFARPGRRRRPLALVLAIDLDDLAFAHVEPRRSIFDLPRFVFGHPGGAMSYEIAGKYVLQLRHAIERLEESADL